MLPCSGELLQVVKNHLPELETSVEAVISSLESSRYLDHTSETRDSRIRGERPPEQQSNSEKMKDKMNKLFNKQGHVPFWKK